MNYQYTVTYKQQTECAFVFESLDEFYSTIIEEVHNGVPFYFYYGIENRPRVATEEIVESELDKSGYVYLFSRSYEKGLTVRKRIVI